VLASADGVSWDEHSAGTSKTLVGVAWTGSRFIAVGEDGIRFESVDGAAWNASSSRTINDLHRVRYIGNNLFVTGRYGTILRGSCTAERAVTAPTIRPSTRRVREQTPTIER
jgi:hypothetical protein